MGMRKILYQDIYNWISTLIFSADNRDPMRRIFFLNFFLPESEYLYAFMQFCAGWNYKSWNVLLENCRNSDLLLYQKQNKGKHINIAL